MLGDGLRLTVGAPREERLAAGGAGVVDLLVVDALQAPASVIVDGPEDVGPGGFELAQTLIRAPGELPRQSGRLAQRFTGGKQFERDIATPRAAERIVAGHWRDRETVDGGVTDREQLVERVGP